MAKKFGLLNAAGQYSIVLLAAAFLISFVLFVLPRFPATSVPSVDRSWFVMSWNLPGPLMFISVFRIHVLRVINEKILGKKNTMGITKWVRFWFIISVMFGIASLAFQYFLNFGALPLHLMLASTGIVAFWLVLVISTLFLLRTNPDREILKSIGKYRTRERFLLALTSGVFLVFTGFSTIVLSLPA